MGCFNGIDQSVIFTLGHFDTEASADLKGGIGKAFAALVGLLKGGSEADLGEWRGACESVGLTEAVTHAAFRNAFKRATDSLVSQEFIEIKDEKVVHLTGKGVTRSMLRLRKKPPTTQKA